VLPRIATLVTGGSDGRSDSLDGASKEEGETPMPPDADELGAETGGDVDIEGVVLGDANLTGWLVGRKRGDFSPTVTDEG